MSPELKQAIEIPDTWARCEITGVDFPTRGTIYALEEANYFAVNTGSTIKISPAKGCTPNTSRFTTILQEVLNYAPHVQVLFF